MTFIHFLCLNKNYRVVYLAISHSKEGKDDFESNNKMASSMFSKCKIPLYQINKNQWRLHCNWHVWGIRKVLVILLLFVSTTLGIDKGYGLLQTQTRSPPHVSLLNFLKIYLWSERHSYKAHLMGSTLMILS